MKQISIVVLLVFLSIVACNDSNNIDDVKLTTKTDSVSYSIGLDIGKSFKMQGIEFDGKALLAGITHAAADTALLTVDEVKSIMIKFQQEMQQKQQEKMTDAAAKNKAEADAFFAENASKEGVVTLPSGLQYKIIKSGNGKTPTATSTVEAHYAGRLLDGTEFDNSYNRGEPFKTTVNGVIAGWTEVLQLMKEGDKWEVYIPSDLAYGERGTQGTIGPNAALIFEMELISVN